jgi:DNA-binding response OmpR family regulator
MQIGVETSKAVDNKRIFVIDEDEIIRAALQFRLHDENETHEAPSLEWAFDKAVDWPPDLVIFSEALLHRHGAALYGEIRERLRGPKVMIVLEPGGVELAKKCLAEGADSVAIKPLRIELIRRKADLLLGRLHESA